MRKIKYVKNYYKYNEHTEGVGCACVHVYALDKQERQRHKEIIQKIKK